MSIALLYFFQEGFPNTVHCSTVLSEADRAIRSFPRNPSSPLSGQPAILLNTHHHFLYSLSSLLPPTCTCDVYDEHVSMIIVGLQGPLLFPGSSLGSTVVVRLRGLCYNPGPLPVWRKTFWIFCTGSILSTGGVIYIVHAIPLVGA